MTINIKAEVEALLGRPFTPAEENRYYDLRSVGYANPIDIHAIITGE